MDAAMPEASLAPLFETGTMGLVTADAAGRVETVRGPVASWARPGDDLFELGPFGGLEEDLAAVRLGRLPRLALSNLRFGTDGASLSLAATWDGEAARFVVLVTGFGEEELSDVIARRVRREQRIAQEMLAGERRRAFELYRRAPAMLCTVDAEGRVIEASDAWCARLMVSREEAIGMTLAERFSVAPEDAVARGVLAPIAAGEVVTDLPVSLRRADGKTLEVEISAVPSRFLDVASGQEGRHDALAVMLDVTARNAARRELQEAARRLEAANAALGTANEDLQIFANGASHDLQAGLHQIAWCAERAEQAIARDEAAREHVAAARAMTARMLEMVLSLLSYARAASRQARMRDVDPAQAVEAVRDILQQMLVRREASLEVSGPLAPVRADLSLLVVLLQNLVQNALKYNDSAHPRVEVSSLRIGGGRIALRVDDNGVGIPPEMRARVLKPFQRVDAQSHRNGLGIGLTLCARVVELMEGELRLLDSPLGGTRIEIELGAVPRKGTG